MKGAFLLFLNSVSFFVLSRRSEQFGVFYIQFLEERRVLCFRYSLEAIRSFGLPIKKIYDFERGARASQCFGCVFLSPILSFHAMQGPFLESILLKISHHHFLSELRAPTRFWHHWPLPQSVAETRTWGFVICVPRSRDFSFVESESAREQVSGLSNRLSDRHRHRR